MKHLKNVAMNRCTSKVLAAFSLFSVLALGGCSALPQPPVRADLYDFGPGLSQPLQTGVQSLPPLALAEVEMLGQPEGSLGLLYRLAYSNDQRLLPYTQARWSQAPAVLMQQALRARLGQQRAVLTGDDGLALMSGPGRMPTVLRVQVEEFSQIFSAPQQSHGLLRMRALVADASAAGETLVAQRLFVVRRPAATADSTGGARALAEAAAQAADELADWLATLGR